MIASCRNSIAKMLACLVLVSTFALPAGAQTTSEPEPYRNVDEFGVDLSTGTFNFSLQELKGGSANNGINVTRIWGRSGWKYPYSGHLKQTSSSAVTIVRGGVSESFTLSGSVWVSVKGNGATLTRSSNVGFPTYVYTAADGTVITYQTVGANALTPEDSYPKKYTVVTDPGGCSFGTPQTISLGATQRCAVPVSIVAPSGARVDLNWLEEGTCFQYYNSFSDQGWQCDDRTRLVSVSDQSGYKVSYSYTTSTYDYSPSWWQRSGATLTDESTGSSVSATYSYPSGPTQQITDQYGGTWTFGFASGKMTTITRPAATSATTSIAYGADGKVSSVTKDGVTKNYTWSTSSGNTVVAISGGASGSGSVTSSPTAGQPGTVTDANSKSVVNTYDANGRLKRTTYPELNYVEYTYDARGNITNTLINPKPGSSLAAINVSANFDSTCSNTVKCNKPNWTINANGQQTDYTYSPVHGQVTQVKLPAPSTGQPRPEIDYSYTALYAQVKNASGTLVNESTPQYKLTQITSCATAATCSGSVNETKVTIAYNTPNLQPTSVTVAAGDGSISRTTSYTYDANDNLTSVDGPLSGTGDTEYYFYDSSNRPTGSISADPDGSGGNPRLATRISYDSAGRVWKQERGTVTGTTQAAFDAMSVQQTIETTFDGNDRKTSVVLKGSDGVKASVTQYSYDNAGRLQCTAVRMDPSQWSTQSDACTPQTNGADGPDRITRLYYDALGRVNRQESGVGTSALGDDAATTYTDNGKVATATDGEANKTTYEYDGFDRLTKTRFPVATKGANTSSTTDYEQLTYYPTGSVHTRRTRGGDTLTYNYDDLGRLTSKIVPARSGVPATDTRNVYYGYDLQGRPLYARFDSTSGEGLSFAYNALGEMTSTTQAMDGASRTLSYQYDAAGNRTRLTHPDGAYISMLYDGLDRLTSMTWWTAGSGTVPFAGISYNAVGQRTSMGRASSGTSYSYDAIGRLASLGQNFAGGTGNVTQTFSYNHANQITSQTRDNDAYAWTDAKNTNRSYTPNGLDQYSAVAGTNFTYDGNGNLTHDDKHGYTYDVENRLIASDGVTLRYDPLGRLYEVVGSTTGTTRFLYDGDSLIGEYDTAGTMKARYIWGSNPDELVVADQGALLNCSGTRAMQPDERGSIIATADCWGNRQSINTYDEYGIPGASNTGRFQYTGQAWIPELGMYYYKARMYSPTLGRFMQTDPIGYSDGMNWYNYVGSDPVNGVDPTGLACNDDKKQDNASDGGGGGTDCGKEILVTGFGFHGTFSTRSVPSIGNHWIDHHITETLRDAANKLNDILVIGEKDSAEAQRQLTNLRASILPDFINQGNAIIVEAIRLELRLRSAHFSGNSWEVYHFPWESRNSVFSAIWAQLILLTGTLPIEVGPDKFLIKTADGTAVTSYFTNSTGEPGLQFKINGKIWKYKF